MTAENKFLRLSHADVAGVHVLVVGDVMLDRFVYGSVDRISPEAPIPVVRANQQTHMLGGAGNVARNLSALGAQCRLITVVGDDPAAVEDSVNRVRRRRGGARAS